MSLPSNLSLSSDEESVQHSSTTPGRGTSFPLISLYLYLLVSLIYPLKTDVDLFPLDQAFYNEPPLFHFQFHPVTNKFDIYWPEEAHEHFLSEIPPGLSCDEEKWVFVEAAHLYVNRAWLLTVLLDPVRCRSFINYVKCINATPLLQGQKWKCFQFRHDPRKFGEYEMTMETPATVAPGVQSVTPEENDGTELFPDDEKKMRYFLSVAKQYLADKPYYLTGKVHDSEEKIVGLVKYLFDNGVVDDFKNSFQEEDGSIKPNTFVSKASNSSFRREFKSVNLPTRFTRNVLYLTLYLMEVSFEKKVPTKFNFVTRKGEEKGRCVQYIKWFGSKTGWSMDDLLA